MPRRRPGKDGAPRSRAYGAARRAIEKPAPLRAEAGRLSRQLVRRAAKKAGQRAMGREERNSGPAAFRQTLFVAQLGGRRSPHQQ